MWRAQLHRRKPRAAQRENSGAGGNRRMGTALLPDTQPAGRGPWGAAPQSLHPGLGWGSASAGSCRTGAAVLGRASQLSQLQVTRARMEVRCRWAKAPALHGVRCGLTWQLPRSVCALAPQQPVLRSEIHKAVPTKTVLLLQLFSFNGVGWHSPALWVQPRRLLMLSFLECKGGVNGLTQESWLPWPWYILVVVLEGWLTSNWDYKTGCLQFGASFGIWVFTSFYTPL